MYQLLSLNRAGCLLYQLQLVCQKNALTMDLLVIAYGEIALCQKGPNFSSALRVLFFEGWVLAMVFEM